MAFTRIEQSRLDLTFFPTPTNDTAKCDVPLGASRSRGEL